jgi:hypothetical protein
MVDLGKATAIDQVGLSLLHDPDAGFPFPETLVMEVSEDAKTWQSLNRRNFRFEYSAADEFKKAEMAQRQPIMVLVPGPRVKSEFEGYRYFRIHVQAPQVCIDEMIVNPHGRE